MFVNLFDVVVADLAVPGRVLVVFFCCQWMCV